MWGADPTGQMVMSRGGLELQKTEQNPRSLSTHRKKPCYWSDSFKMLHNRLGAKKVTWYLMFCQRMMTHCEMLLFISERLRFTRMPAEKLEDVMCFSSFQEETSNITSRKPRPRGDRTSCWAECFQDPRPGFNTTRKSFKFSKTHLLRF